MNLPPELQDYLDLIKQEYANGEFNADETAKFMLEIAGVLPETERAEFVTGTIPPFLQTAHMNGELNAYDAACCMLDIADRLCETARAKFLNEMGIYLINLKTKAWDSLTYRWLSINGSGDKMVLYTRGALGNGKPFAEVSYETVTMDNFESLLDQYDIKGRARSPFLRAVEAVKIEQEHPGFFAGFNRMCRSLKIPEVG